MFKLNTIVIIFRIENVDSNDLNRYLFEIDWNINRQSNWLSINVTLTIFYTLLTIITCVLLKCMILKASIKNSMIFSNIIWIDIADKTEDAKSILKRKNYLFSDRSLSNLSIYQCYFYFSLNLKHSTFAKTLLISIMTIIIL